jgi:hypothetical protein
MPALLMRIWTPPQCSFAAATIASTCSASVTLAPFAIASPPAAAISSTTAAAAELSGAVAGAAEIVHDHLGAAPGELERIGAAKAAAGAGDDGDSAFEADGHGSSRFVPNSSRAELGEECCQPRLMADRSRRGQWSQRARSRS